jgi:hypothetical protein
MDFSSDGSIPSARSSSISSARLLASRLKWMEWHTTLETILGAMNNVTDGCASEKSRHCGFLLMTLGTTSKAS